MRNIFISYRSLDAQLASALADCVESVGAEPYLDRRDPALETISVGAIERRRPVMQSIRDGLKSADTLVAVITRLARGSWWLPAEVALGLEMGKEVVAICETDVRPPDFDIHHLILNEDQFRVWLATLGSGRVKEHQVKHVGQTLFKPVSTNLRQASENALAKIEGLWDPRSWCNFALHDPNYAHRGNWIGCSSERLTSTLHAIAGPVCLYHRETRLDRSELEREVAAMLFYSWCDEESLAAIDPRLPYEARRCRNWRQLRDDDPARYWLQGMKSKDLESLFSEMSEHEDAVASREAFRRLYLERARSSGVAQRPLGLAANPLQGFTLETRPVFARLMAVHARVHRALITLDSAGGVGRTSFEQLFDLPETSPVRGSDGETASLKYILERMATKLRPMLWEESWPQMMPVP